MNRVKGRSPLSANQQFVSVYDVGDDAGPFGPQYTISHAWWCEGEVTSNEVQRATQWLVARHEALNTIIHRDSTDAAAAHQVIHHPSKAYVEERDETSCVDPQARALELLDEEELRPLPSAALPLLRVTLVRFAPKRHLLILTAHHLAADGFAMRALVNDLARLIADEQEVPETPLERVTQYRDYTLWESGQMASSEAEEHRKYWRDTLAGAQIHTWPTDFRRSAGLPPGTGTIRFVIDAETTQEMLSLARRYKCTPFMAYLAVYALACQPESGSDITIPTFTSGRPPAFGQTVGSFFNFMPLRMDLAGCSDFESVVSRVRVAVLDGVDHDIPAIPSLVLDTMSPAMQDDHATGVFQVFPFPDLLDDSLIGNVRYTEIRRRVTSQTRAAEIPDGTLWTITLDPTTRETIGCLSYRTDLYTSETANNLVARFCAQFLNVVRSPSAAAAAATTTATTTTTV